MNKALTAFQDRVRENHYSSSDNLNEYQSELGDYCDLVSEDIKSQLSELDLEIEIYTTGDSIPMTKPFSVAFIPKVLTQTHLEFAPVFPTDHIDIKDSQIGATVLETIDTVIADLNLNKDHIIYWPIYTYENKNPKQGEYRRKFTVDTQNLPLTGAVFMGFAYRSKVGPSRHGFENFFAKRAPITITDKDFNDQECLPRNYWRDNQSGKAIISQTKAYADWIEDSNHEIASQMSILEVMVNQSLLVIDLLKNGVRVKQRADVSPKASAINRQTLMLINEIKNIEASNKARDELTKELIPLVSSQNIKDITSIDTHLRFSTDELKQNRFELWQFINIDRQIAFVGYRTKYIDAGIYADTPAVKNELLSNINLIHSEFVCLAIYKVVSKDGSDWFYTTDNTNIDSTTSSIVSFAYIHRNKIQEDSQIEGFNGGELPTKGEAIKELEALLKGLRHSERGNYLRVEIIANSGMSDGYKSKFGVFKSDESINAAIAELVTDYKQKSTY